MFVAAARKESKDIVLAKKCTTCKERFVKWIFLSCNEILLHEDNEENIEYKINDYNRNYINNNNNDNSNNNA